MSVACRRREMHVTSVRGAVANAGGNRGSGWVEGGGATRSHGNVRLVSFGHDDVSEPQPRDRLELVEGSVGRDVCVTAGSSLKMAGGRVAREPELPTKRGVYNVVRPRKTVEMQ